MVLMILFFILMKVVDTAYNIKELRRNFTVFEDVKSPIYAANVEIVSQPIKE